MRFSSEFEAATTAVVFRVSVLAIVLGFTFGHSFALADAQMAPPIPPGLTVVSMSTAENLFHEVATDPEIPFDYPDGCYAKAEKADIFLEKKGVIAGKTFVEGQIYNQSHWGGSYWLFHVAPIILVRDSGRVRPYVIDPFLSKKLLSYGDWLALVKSDPATTIAKAYFTNRFVYGPFQKKLNPDHYDKGALEDMEIVLQQIRNYLAGYNRSVSQ